nr:immunoglobulin heavy chain junction region [Macaca mulatta]MOX96176.1 immunoglobulin heavy chain junction region [Macaca mulatta]MOX96218.1 immunoglobulin heavy chain junction region [Macaca mulatta]
CARDSTSIYSWNNAIDHW